MLTRIIGVSRARLGLPGTGNATFQDLHDRPLIFPSGAEGPFRRLMVWHAKACFDEVIAAHRPHAIALQYAPSKEEFKSMFIGRDEAFDPKNCSEVMQRFIADK